MPLRSRSAVCRRRPRRADPEACRGTSCRRARGPRAAPCNFPGAGGHYLGVKPMNAGTPLDCASARLLIDAYLLGALDAASGAALRVHLAGCVACSVELRGFTSLVELLATMPEPVASPDFDERLILAAIADRRRRHEHHSWLQDLPRLVFRGAMRTTGTLIVTLVSVALLSAALVFAAGNFFAGTALIPTPGATVAPEVTPTLAPTPQRTAVPTSAPTETTGPVAVSATPVPTPEPTMDTGADTRADARPRANSRRPSRRSRPPPRQPTSRGARRRPHPPTRPPPRRTSPHRRSSRAGRARLAVPGLPEGCQHRKAIAGIH